MKVEKKKFDSVLGKMLKAAPVKRSEARPQRRPTKAAQKA